MDSAMFLFYPFVAMALLVVLASVFGPILIGVSREVWTEIITYFSPNTRRSLGAPDGVRVKDTKTLEEPDFTHEPWFPHSTPMFSSVSFDTAMTLFARNGRIDAVLITVNDVEFTAVAQKFFVQQDAVMFEAFKGSLTIRFGTIGGENLGLAVIKQSMGAFNQHRTCVEAVQLLQPRAIISVGVGWGNVRLGGRYGDVMVAEKLVEFTYNTKVSADGSVHSRSEIPQAGGLLVNRFSGMADAGRWIFNRPGPPSEHKKCRIFKGKFATGGLLLDNESFMTKLLSSPDFCDVTGGDMEAWGLASAFAQTADNGATFQWIVVKGICDFGFGKNKIWQPLAAAAAADLVYKVLSAKGVLPALT